MDSLSLLRKKLIIYFIGFTAALAGLLFGLDVGVISGALPLLKNDFKLSIGAEGAVVSALLWGAVIGTLISGMLSSNFGRRKTILISAVIFVMGSVLSSISPSEHLLIGARLFLGITMGVAMITVGTLFNMGIEKHPEIGYFAIFALLIFIIGFAMSAGPIIWVICSEIYPLAGRDLGVTFSTATNWIANAIVGMTFLLLLAGLGNGNTFLLYGALNIVFIIFFVIFVPETKGVSLEKIEANLLSGLPLKQIGRSRARLTHEPAHYTRHRFWRHQH
jgi:MFS family permease